MNYHRRTNSLHRRHGSREYLGIYVRKGESSNYNITKIEDLLSNDFTIGAELGTSYGVRTDNILKQVEKQRITSVPFNSGQNSKKLILKRMDGYLSYPASEVFLLKEHNAEDQVELHPMPLINTGDIYFMLSKKSNSYEILEALNAAFVEIKADGTYDKIIQKYSDLYGISQW